MIIDIHDVEHGACAVITAPNGKRLMIDCGHNSDTGWRPSDHYRGAAIEELVVSNYDRDHVSDFVGVMRHIPPRFIRRNTSVSARDLAKMKYEDGEHEGIALLRQWMASVEGRPGTGFPDYGPDMTVRHFWNEFPYFEEENDLSVVTVVDGPGLRVLFSGDMEQAGWRNLVQHPEFADLLAGVDVFVASHHGRRNGCSEEAMRIANPQIVIISDGDKEHESQETTPWYQARSRGIWDTPQNRRHVYTTRCDGHIRLWQVQGGAWRIDPYSRLQAA